MAHFWVILDHFCDVLGSLWGQVSIVLASFRGRFVVILRSFWAFWGHFWVFSVFLRSFFLDFWWHIENSNAKMSKMRQYNAKTYMQFSAKIDQKLGKIMQKQAFLRL